MKEKSQWLIIIGLAALFAYANSIGGGFVYDDNRQIARNPLIQDLSLAGKALTSDVWAFKGDGSVTASNYWRPTFTAWHIANFQAFGMRPAGWHATNVLLHIAVCLAAFLLLVRWGIAEPAAFGATLVFAVHPVHVESVAWISGATDPLFALAVICSFHFAESYRETRSWPKLVLALLAYALALGAKEVALLCLPVYWLIFSRADAEKTPHVRTLAASAPFAVMAVAFFAARWAVLGSLTQPVENAPPVRDALLSVPSVLVFYFNQILLPITLSINYPLRPVSDTGTMTFAVPLGVALVVIGLLAFLARRTYAERNGFALLFLPLLPVLLITSFPRDQIVHDRYLYLPLLGFLIIAFANLERFFRDRLRLQDSARFVFAAAVLVSVPLGIATVRYNRIWANDLSLWERTVAVDPANVSGLVNYGVALTDAGRAEEAIGAFNRSIDVQPTAYAYLGRAQNFIRTGKFEEAVWDLQTVTEMPNDEVNAYTLFQSYEALGVALERKNDLARAERFLREARRRLPIYSAALTEKIAVLLYRQERKREALLELEAARQQARIELLPSSKTVFLRLGMLRAEMGDRAGAREALAEYLRLTTPLHDRITLADRAQALELMKKL